MFQLKYLIILLISLVDFSFELIVLSFFLFFLYLYFQLLGFVKFYPYHDYIYKLYHYKNDSYKQDNIYYNFLNVLNIYY